MPSSLPVRSAGYGRRCKFAASHPSLHAEARDTFPGFAFFPCTDVRESSKKKSSQLQGAYLMNPSEMGEAMNVTPATKPSRSPVPT